MIAALAGGVGAARLLRGLVRVVPATEVTAVVNTGDDTELHGLSICPDVDTVLYTLAGRNDEGRGWGLAGETWSAMDALEELGGEAWFRLGDRDLATHLFRTGRLRQGVPLSAVTTELCRAMGVDVSVIPVTDGPMATRLTLQSDGTEVAFQDYFVRLRHEVAVSAVRFDGAERCSPAPGVIEALEQSEVIVICPSNPVVSIGPVLAVPGVADVLRRRRDRVVAVSPIVAGSALKGPADRLMAELGEEPSVVGVARRYTPVAGTLVIDEADRDRAAEVRGLGLQCVVVPTVMHGLEESQALAKTVVNAARG